MYRIQQEDEYIGCTSTKFCYREKLSDAQTVFNDYKRIVGELFKQQEYDMSTLREGRTLIPHKYAVSMYELCETCGRVEDQLIERFVPETIPDVTK